jgi:hypothetical protein
MFAMDGVDTTDPELGGATFSNFNVDAVQEIESLSGVMPAEIGHGAAGFTNIKTKSGTNQLHGSVFEFVRNAAFDARSFFDRRTLAEPGRIPPFIRNEFGFALGGPVTLPGIYRGRDRTFFPRAVSGVPPGAGNHAGAFGAHPGGAPGAGHDGLSGRHPLCSRQ